MTTRSLDADIIESQESGKRTGQTGTLPPLVSTRQKIIKRFFRHKLAIVGLVVLIILYASALLADFIAPYGMASADRSKPYAPPSRVHVFDKGGNFVGPFIYEIKEMFDPQTRTNKYFINPNKIYKMQFFTHGEPYKFLGFVPMDFHLFGVEAPGRMYLWGGDMQGRDLFSRLLFGARISLTIGIMAIMISYPLGLIIGGISGYFGGIVDTIIMRIVEAIITFPSLYLLLTLAATLPKNLSSVQRYILIVVILSFIGWAGQARIYRGQVLGLKQMEYVEAARAVGVSDFWIIVKHILPQMASWIIVSATISIPAYTLGEAYLSFLSLGIQDPQASWGLMLQEVRSNLLNLQGHPWLLIPGFAIVFTVFAFNFFGDGLRDAFDAKKKI